MIQFDRASKTYRALFGRAVHAVQDFSLEIGDGEVLGIAGANGAGKSTLIAMLLGYQFPTSGRVVVHGESPRRYVEKWGMGYVSELITIEPRWRVREALYRFAMLAGVPSNEIDARVEACIEMMGLEPQRDKKISALSKGNAQRVALAQAMLREERITVFDEPTHGLDPVWTQRFRDVVQAMRRPDRIIIIASHNLDELQRLSDRVAIIDQGQLQRLVTTRFGQGAAAGDTVTSYRLIVAQGAEQVAAVFDGAVGTGNGEFEIVVPDLARLNHGLAELLRRGVLVSSVTPAHSALEEYFRMAVTRGES